MEDHHSCQFGKWYDTVASDAFGKNNTLEKMSKAHEIFHEVISQNTGFVNEGADSLQKNKELIIKNFELAETSSQELFALMDKLVVETKGDIDLEKI